MYIYSATTLIEETFIKKQKKYYFLFSLDAFNFVITYFNCKQCCCHDGRYANLICA